MVASETISNTLEYVLEQLLLRSGSHKGTIKTKCLKRGLEMLAEKKKKRKPMQS